MSAASTRSLRRGQAARGTGRASLGAVRNPLLWLVLALACLAAAACGPDTNPLNPTPASLPDILGVLGRNGISVSNITSGDAGCDDQDLAHTAVSFLASGFDQSTPTRVHIYGFRNRATFQRLASSVDACARSYVTDTAAYGNIAVSPFVAAGQGPWAPEFTDHLRSGLTQAAGNGG